MDSVTKDLLDALKDAEVALTHFEKVLHVRVNPGGLEKMRAAIARAEEALASPRPDADGWIPWVATADSQCPVGGNVLVEARLATGYFERAKYADKLMWKHVGDLSIIAYKIIEKAVNPAEVSADTLEQARAEEREAWPELTWVIQWLEAGCDPKDAAKELRLIHGKILAKEPK